MPDKLPILISAGQPAMVLNVLWNRRYGPGGGTRRLHHLPGGPSGPPLWGRNRIDVRGKDKAFARYGTRRYRAKRIVANDNYAPVAQAA